MPKANERILSSTHLRVADKAGMVARKVKNMTKKHKTTNMLRYVHFESQDRLIALKSLKIDFSSWFLLLMLWFKTRLLMMQLQS